MSNEDVELEDIGSSEIGTGLSWAEILVTWMEKRCNLDGGEMHILRLTLMGVNIGTWMEMRQKSWNLVGCEMGHGLGLDSAWMKQRCNSRNLDGGELQLYGPWWRRDVTWVEERRQSWYLDWVRRELGESGWRCDATKMGWEGKEDIWIRVKRDLDGDAYLEIWMGWDRTWRMQFSWPWWRCDVTQMDVRPERVWNGTMATGVNLGEMWPWWRWDMNIRTWMEARCNSRDLDKAETRVREWVITFSILFEQRTLGSMCSI